MAAAMKKSELKRRERLARKDLAASARYHAGRLPESSEWKGPIEHLAARLDPAGEIEVTV